MYTGRTTEEAIRKWHLDALNKMPLIVLGRALGIELDWDVKKHPWIEDGKQPGFWHRKNQRDEVRFAHPNIPDKITRIIHDIRPAGELKNELAIVDTAGPNDYDSEETLSWGVGRSATLTETTSQTHGWSMLVKLGFEAGSQNNKVTGGIELGAHGDYSSGKAEDKGETVDASKSTKIMLPKGEIAKLMQTIQSGPGIADVEDRIVLGINFEVEDYKKRLKGIEGRLKDHAGFRAGGGRNRVHWEVTDANDLRTAFEGTNPRYPGIAGRNLDYFGKDVRWARDWMLDEGNRTLLVRSQAHFDMSIFSNSRVMRVDADGDLVEDREVD